MQDPVKLYNPTKLSDFQNKYSLIDWTGILKSLIPNGGIQVTDKIIVTTPEYYERLNALLSSGITLQTLQEYFIIRYVLSKVYSLDNASRAANRAMNGEISSGTSVEQPRWRICVGFTSNTYSNSLGRYYTLKKFGSEAERERAAKFLTTIHEAWLNRIPQIDWLDEQTRKKTIEKVIIPSFSDFVTISNFFLYRSI
jgi:predicted metalloendopeptidase